MRLFILVAGFALSLTITASTVWAQSSNLSGCLAYVDVKTNTHPNFFFSMSDELRVNKILKEKGYSLVSLDQAQFKIDIFSATKWDKTSSGLFSSVPHYDITGKIMSFIRIPPFDKDRSIVQATEDSTEMGDPERFNTQDDFYAQFTNEVPKMIQNTVSGLWSCQKLRNVLAGK